MTPALELLKVSKSFGPLKAVDDITFAVERGEILGLVGPNGAGKTTTIRLALDLLKPDYGTISILGGAMQEAKKDRIGYMPEERGLYQDITLERVLVYLATLKNLPPAEAKRRTEAWLKRFDLTDYRHRKVKELSKGMQQKAQMIATLLHEPELVIVDEPFSGLDPLNTQMIKQLLLEQRRQGVTIIMSTHLMHQVEELCDRLLLINQGRSVLYGELDDIRRQYTGHAILVRVNGELPDLPGVTQVDRINGTFRLSLAETTAPQEVLRWLTTHGVAVEKYEVAVPTLEEIFIQAVNGETNGTPRGDS